MHVLYILPPFLVNAKVVLYVAYMKGSMAKGERCYFKKIQ